MARPCSNAHLMAVVHTAKRIGEGSVNGAAGGRMPFLGVYPTIRRTIACGYSRRKRVTVSCRLAPPLVASGEAAIGGVSPKWSNASSNLQRRFLRELY